MGDATASVFIQLLVSGMAFGSIYAMVAIGFNIIYNATGIINLAQGEFVMLGAMLTVWGHETLGLPIWADVIVATALVAMVGVAFERVAIRPLRAPSILTLILITIAASYIFRGSALLIWSDRYFSIDPFLGATPVRFLGAVVTRQHLLVLATLSVVVALLVAFFGYTLTGKAMRACSFNRTSARLVGINTRSMVMLAFAMSAGIGGLAGVVIVPITGVVYDNGPLLGLKGFAAAVLGGLGNNYAAVVAGLALGVLESLAAGYVSSDFKNAIALGILLVVLFIRPSGIFGRTELSRLSEF